MDNGEVEHTEPAPFPLAYDPAPYRNRPDAAVEKRGFDYVLVWSYSRLSRRLAELARLRRTLEHLGVEVVSASEAVVEVRLDDLLTALGGGEFDAA